MVALLPTMEIRELVGRDCPRVRLSVGVLEEKLYELEDKVLAATEKIKNLDRSFLTGQIPIAI